VPRLVLERDVPLVAFRPARLHKALVGHGGG
jgi:hypothetical protein